MIILGGTGGLFGALYLLGRFYPGDGRDVLEWKPTRSPEAEIQNEIDDLDQMLEAANRRRRARGESELTEEILQAQVAEHTRAQSKSRDEHLADLEIVQMLEVKNRRRAAKGLPPLTAEEYKAELEGLS